ncbi:hypothetical protein LCGC14_1336510, partial [marine sediment metagenome]
MPDDMTTNSSTTSSSSDAYIRFSDYITVDGSANITVDGLSGTTIKNNNGIHPRLYFKYIKSKFGLLEKIRLDNRVKRIEKAFDKATDNGQYALAEKFLENIARETRESMIYAKGIRHFIEREHLNKHKSKIRGGHISDTPLEDFTRVIPKKALVKKKKV